ncbi:thymidine kinase, partial [Baffinella frigidus]
GPMFAGKSTELMRRIRRHKLASRKCIVIKYALDVRHGEAIDELATHDNNRIPARPCSRLADVLDEMKDADVVGIDEAQFYPDLVDVCEELANLGKVVILSALDGTFQKEPFGPVLTLLPRAESITKLSAVCKVRKP